MSGKIFSATDGKYRFHNCVEYELQSVLESSIFGWSCVFGLSSPSHVEGLPFPCHNIPEYIPSIARSCKTTEMSELKSNKAAVLLQQVFGFAIKLFSKDKNPSPLQHVWDPGEHFGCHLRLSTVSRAHHQVASWLEVFVSFLLFANLLSSQRIAHNLDSFTDLPKQDQNALLKVDFSILCIHSFSWPNHNELLRKFFLRRKMPTSWSVWEALSFLTARRRGWTKCSYLWGSVSCHVSYHMGRYRF